MPIKGAHGLVVKGETFFAENQTEDVVSKSEAGRRGLKPIGDPVGTKRGQVGGGAKTREWELYRVSECHPKQTRNTCPPRTIDILAATFAVNRAAKRFRDAASQHYLHGVHGFAGSCSGRKYHLYLLKERGIVTAYREGRIQCECIHGNLAVYRGEGYCFHSPLIPESLDMGPADNDAPIMVEGKPRELREPRLKDAEYTLGSLSDSTEGFRRLELPRFEEVQHETSGSDDKDNRSEDWDEEDEW